MSTYFPYQTAVSVATTPSACVHKATFNTVIKDMEHKKIHPGYYTYTVVNKKEEPKNKTEIAKDLQENHPGHHTITDVKEGPEGKDKKEIVREEHREETKTKIEMFEHKEDPEMIMNQVNPAMPNNKYQYWSGDIHTGSTNGIIQVRDNNNNSEDDPFTRFSKVNKAPTDKDGLEEVNNKLDQISSTALSNTSYHTNELPYREEAGSKLGEDMKPRGQGKTNVQSTHMYNKAGQASPEGEDSEIVKMLSIDRTLRELKDQTNQDRMFRSGSASTPVSPVQCSATTTGSGPTPISHTPTSIPLPKAVPSTPASSTSAQDTSQGAGAQDAGNRLGTEIGEEEQHTPAPDQPTPGFAQNLVPPGPTEPPDRVPDKVPPSPTVPPDRVPDKIPPSPTVPPDRVPDQVLPSVLGDPVPQPPGRAGRGGTARPATRRQGRPSGPVPVVPRQCQLPGPVPAGTVPAVPTQDRPAPHRDRSVPMPAVPTPASHTTGSQGTVPVPAGGAPGGGASERYHVHNIYALSTSMVTSTSRTITTMTPISWCHQLSRLHVYNAYTLVMDTYHVIHVTWTATPVIILYYK